MLIHAFDRDYFVQVLGDVLSSKFAPHEYTEEVLPQVQGEYDQVLQQPQTLGFDVLTQTAYRQKGLGASLFSTPSSPVSHSQIVSFAQSAFAKDNIAIVGSGIDTSKLSDLTSKYFKNVRASKGALAAGPNKYFGGDARVSFAPDHSAEGPRAHYGHYLIAFQGAGLDASPELAVLRSHMGGESNVKWSTGLSPLAQISDKVAGANVNAFNVNFTDAGLIGAYITAPHSKILEAAKLSVAALKDASQSISKEDLEKAKAKARFEAASSLESRAAIHSAVGGVVCSIFFFIISTLTCPSSSSTLERSRLWKRLSPRLRVSVLLLCPRQQAKRCPARQPLLLLGMSSIYHTQMNAFNSNSLSCSAHHKRNVIM